MDELRRVIRILMDRFFPRSYDYHDYSDDRRSSAPGAAAGGEEAAKAQKVKILAGIILVAGIPFSFYIYNVRDEHRVARRSAAASPVAENGEEETAHPSVLPQNQTLDDLRRWAANVERQAQRGELDSVPRSSAAGLNAYLSFDDGIMEDPWSEAVSKRRREQNPLIDTAPLFPEPAAPPAMPPAPAEIPYAVEATTTVPAPAAAPAVDAVTTPETPYHRRRYEPIAIDPRAVDPY